MAESLRDELEEIELAASADADRDAQTLAALGVVNRNLIAIGRIIFARFDNDDAGDRAIIARLAAIEAELAPTVAGPAVSGITALNGVESTRTGANTMADTIKDNAPAAKLSVAWSDAKGAPADGVTDAWSGDNDAVGTVTNNGDGTATFTPVSVGTVNIKVVGTNADGTTAEATDSVTVTASDAVGGTITLTP